MDLKKGDVVTVEYLRKVNSKIHAELIVNKTYKPPVFEQVVKQQKEVTSETAQPVVRQPEPDVPGVRKMMVGTLTTVDSKKGTITVCLRGNDYTIGITVETKIFANERTISLKDFKKGDIVAVKYFKYQNGNRCAIHINNRTRAMEK